MTERKWLPSEWSDEIIPNPLASPDDFLCKKADGTFWMVVDGDVNNLNDPEEAWNTQIELGQVVHFLAHEFYGVFSVEVSGDPGQSAATDHPYPAKANCFVPVDVDGDIFESLESFAAEQPPGQYDISIYWWSVEETPFRFELDHDGKPKFSICHGAS